MQDYAEYKREFMRDWTRKVSRAAGVAEGRGRRGTKLLEDLLLELFPGANKSELDAHKTKWMRWKAGQQTPSLYNFQKVHSHAVMLGYLGQGARAVMLRQWGQRMTLRDVKECAGMMSQSEWERSPEFEFQEQQDELLERLDRLDKDETRIKKEKESLGEALGILEQPQCLSPLERAEQLERQATDLLREAAEIRRIIDSGSSAKLSPLLRYSGKPRDSIRSTVRE